MVYRFDIRFYFSAFEMERELRESRKEILKKKRREREGFKHGMVIGKKLKPALGLSEKKIIGNTSLHGESSTSGDFIDDRDIIFPVTAPDVCHLTDFDELLLHNTVADVQQEVFCTMDKMKKNNKEKLNVKKSESQWLRNHKSFQDLRGKKKKSVCYTPGPNKPPHNRKTMESRVASLKYLINQLFHEDNCHIVAFIAQENQVKWSPDLLHPENIPAPILKRTKEGKTNLGPILEFVETPEVEAAKKVWINIYKEKQAIRVKTPEWIQAKCDRLETSRSKREEIKKKQLEAANSTATNLSPVSFSLQESETLPSNIISPDNNMRFSGGESIIAEATANNAEFSHQLPLPNEMASSSGRATPPINHAKKKRSQEIDKVYSWRGKMYFWCPFAKPSAKYVIAASFPKDARVINLPEDPANLKSCHVDL